LSKCTIGGLSRRAQLHGDITLIFWEKCNALQLYTLLN
jgi:hypothetical protein